MTHVPVKPSAVAIITRTKDRAIFLRRAVESVLGQTFADWQHVIVNDGSPPDPVEKALAPYRAQYGERLKVIHNLVSPGKVRGLNIGVRATASKYLVIHDDDDSWRPEFLARCVDYLENRPRPDVRGVVTHSTRVIERVEGDQIIRVFTNGFNTWLRAISLYRMAVGNTFPPISFVFERAALDEIGPFREDLIRLADWEFNMRFLARYDIDLIPEELACYHHRPDILEGSYTNSIIGHVREHLYLEDALHSQWLRDDLQRGQFGIGFMAAISQSFEALAQEFRDRLAEMQAALEAQARTNAELAAKLDALQAEIRRQR